jgi:hypothetical protein
LVLGLLAAAVAVKDDPFRRFAGQQRGSESLDDQSGSQVIGDGVTHHFAGMQINHGCGVHPTVEGPHVSNVGAPRAQRARSVMG